MGLSDGSLIERTLQTMLVEDTAYWLRLQPRFRPMQAFQQWSLNEFLLPDYKHRAFKEQQRRTQHHEESLAVFVYLCLAETVE